MASQKIIGLVSPRDQRTATIRSDRANSLVAVCNDGKTYAIADYFSRYPATAFVKNSSTCELEDELVRAQDRVYTLDFGLKLFDPDVSAKLKQRVANELEQLLKAGDNESYALDVILSHPLPPLTDVDGAVAAAATYAAVRQFVEKISASQKRIALVRNAWLAIEANELVGRAGPEAVRGKLVSSGVIRRLVLECQTQADLDKIGGQLAFPAKQAGCDARILRDLISEYRQHLPEGQRGRRSLQSVVSEVQPESEKREVVDYRVATKKQDQALREVEAITNLYIQGDDAKAGHFKSDLVARQSIETNHTYLVKSLCNIASKCSTGGRPDVAAECLEQALDFPAGADCRLFMQMAALFKELGKFEKATDCLQKAEPLAYSVTEQNNVNVNLARLLSARGDYMEALKAFQKLPDIQDSPGPRTSMATVLRKMGRVDEARSVYVSICSANPEHHQARAGLAEANRQNGRYNKAIQKYQQLVKLPGLNVGSMKVYQIALSSLYSLTGNLPKSEEVLNRLLNDFPRDANLQIAMAKLLRLQGQIEQADTLFQRSIDNLDRTEMLAAQLYATAMGNDTIHKPLQIPPELKGLDQCNLSLRKIIAGDFGDVVEQDNVDHVYRLHRDFETVLRYHARCAIDPTTSRVDHVGVNRLRKRGLKELVNAVRSIDERDFGTAVAFEKQICLKAA